MAALELQHLSMPSVASLVKVHQGNAVAAEIREAPIRKVAEIGDVGGVGDIACQAAVADQEAARSQGGEIIGTELVGKGVEILLLPVGHRGLRPVLEDDARTIEIPEGAAQGGARIDMDGGVVQANDGSVSSELGSHQSRWWPRMERLPPWATVSPLLIKRLSLAIGGFAVRCVPVGGCG